MQIGEIPAGTIAVGVDRSPASRDALAWAIDQARLEKRPLTIVHALGAPGMVWVDQAGLDTRIGLEGHATVQTEAQRLLGEARDVVGREAPELEVHELVRVADPRDVLLAVSQRAHLVVMGSRGRGPVRSLLLGSVGVAVTRRAACSVVVVRPGTPGPGGAGILVGVDGTERSLPTLDFAFRQASLRRSPLTVLHVFWDVRATVPRPLPESPAADLDEERLLLAESVSGLREKYPDVPVDLELAEGLPDDRLVRRSQRRSMIVVGSHFGSAASEILFGSVTAWVIEHATCPVAVVPIAGDG